MNRCSLAPFLAAPLLCTSLLCAAQPAAPAAPGVVALAPAGQRNFPAATQVGLLRIGQMPQVQLNGQPVHTAPGFRLFNPDNQIIFGHTVQGQDLHVAYVREASTPTLLTAWILSPAERQRLPLPR